MPPNKTHNPGQYRKQLADAVSTYGGDRRFQRSKFREIFSLMLVASNSTVLALELFERSFGEGAQQQFVQFNARLEKCQLGWILNKMRCDVLLLLNRIKRIHVQIFQKQRSA